MGASARQPDEFRRLQAVAGLEHVVVQRQLDLQVARQMLDAAAAVKAARRQEVDRIDAELADLDRRAHRKAVGIYLDGQVLDRGVLSVSTCTLRHSGWRGRVEIPLGDIAAVELGSSRLPPRAGVPLLERLWPGRPREAGTLLVTVRPDAGAAERLAVIADLDDAAGWRDELLRRKEMLGEAVGQTAAERERAAAALAEAERAVAEAQAPVDALEAEIADLVARAESLSPAPADQQ